MARTPRKTLGLALYGGRILAAEMQIVGPRRLVSRTAEFTFPEDASLSDPEALGKALGQFLRDRQITARRAVIGLPAQWLMTKQQNVPPAEEAALSNLLRIQAERAFSHDGKDLAMDYVAQGGDGDQQSVLLFAATQQKVDQTRTLAEAAGLTVLSVTSSATTLALAGAGGSSSSADLTVQLIPGSIELAIRNDRRFRIVRHLPVTVHPDATGDDDSSPAWIETLTSELRRVMATAANETGAMDNGRLVIWDGVGLPSDATERMGQRLSLEPVETHGLSVLAEVNGTVPSGPASCQFAAAVALARTAADPELLAVDFVHSRLAPPRRTRFDWRMRLASIAAALLVLAIGAMTFDWYSTSQAVKALDEQIEKQTPVVTAAETLIKKVQTAAGWFDARPQCLECLLQLSRLFPADGGIWATDLSLPEDMYGILSGKATEDDLVLEIIKSLQESPAFSEVKLHGGMKYPQETSRDRNLSFSISFRFKEAK